jgi:catechol 2,3-dioxygenase-like lactoylglutathione lyase family enzyme
MRSSPRHLGLRHVALNVGDPQAMKSFYVELLGFSVEWEPDPDNVYLTSGSDNLALHRARPLQGARGEQAGPPQSLDHLGLLVASAEEVDAWAAFLEERGIRLDAGPRTHRDGARSLYLRDPEGNRLQIIYHPPIAG